MIWLRRATKTLGIMLLAFVVLFAGAVAWPAPSAPLPESRQNRLIVNVRIVDVEKGEVSEITNLRIRDGRIVAIGAELPLREGEVRMDGQGGFLIPGLWDMHVHTFQASPQTHFPLWIANGVTQVRDMMDCPQVEDSLIACQADKRRWNEMIADGQMAAPTIVETASFYLSKPEMTPSDAVARIAQYQERGLGAIKVYNGLSAETYAAASRESKARGMRLVGHLPHAVALEEAIAAGQASFEHAHLLPRACFAREAQWRSGQLSDLSPTVLTEAIIDEFDAVRCDRLIAMLASSESWYVPTHVTREDDVRAFDEASGDNPAFDFLDPLSLWAWNDDQTSTRGQYPGERGANALRGYFEHGLRLTGNAQHRGVRILVGTDTIAGGLRYHDELAHLVDAGMSPAEVLRAATIQAARYAEQDRHAGTVAVGKRADLVLLAANPLADIANTRTIRAVLQNGRLYDRARLDQLLSFARDQVKAPHNWAKLVWGFALSSVNTEL